MKKLLLSLLLSGLAVLASAQSVRPHPRLLTGPDGFPGFPDTAGAPVWVRQADSLLTATSDLILQNPPVKRVKTGKRLLSVSRQALKRIFCLSYTYRVHGGEAYARRAIDEMLAVSAFSDWNPTHFLDVGEMAMAVSIGYDWLYGVMTPEERNTVAQAILEKAFDASENRKNAWFYTSGNNWNSVCNAGLVFGAAALWDEYPERCKEILERSLESNPKALNSFSPEGGYPEGYGYWAYGVGFQILLFDALETAFGTDFGLMDTCRERFFGSARFMKFMSTPTGYCYNFSDGGALAGCQFMQAWMALKTGDASLLYPELRLMEKRGPSKDRLFPFFLVALSRMPASEIPVPQDHVYTCGGITPLFLYRSGWESDTDTYLGVKAGLTQSSHSHNDQGSFIFESDGVRWAVDLGMQNYYSIEKLGLDLWDMTQFSDRWNIFRIGPFSHNILTVDGRAPKVMHRAEITRTWEEKGRYGAEVELGKIYGDELAACRREVWTDGTGTLHVTDFIETADSARTVRWALCTAAEAEIRPGKNSADAFVLSGNGVQKQLSFNVLKDWDGQRKLRGKAAPEVRADILPTSAPGPYLHDYDSPNPGTALLCYTVTLPPRARVRLEATLK